MKEERKVLGKQHAENVQHLQKKQAGRKSRRQQFETCCAGDQLRKMSENEQN